ncbi:MAG: hypothetical protein ACI4OV_01480 [Victivallaceae bacterium]
MSGKYRISQKVRLGRETRKVSHALGNSRISGYRDEPDEHTLRNRIIFSLIFLVVLVIGLLSVVF